MPKKSRLYFLITLLACLLLGGQSAFARDVVLANNQILLTPNHGDDGSAWGQTECISCHVKRNIHNTEAGKPIRDIVLETGYASCTGCHGTNGTTAKRECVICHNDDLLPKNPIMQNKKNHNFSVNKDNALTDQNCLDCHDRSDMDGDQYLLL